MMKSELKIRICDKVNTPILKRGVLFKAGRQERVGNVSSLDVCMGKDFCK